jgi:hypothetical protein
MIVLTIKQFGEVTECNYSTLEQAVNAALADYEEMVALPLFIEDADDQYTRLWEASNIAEESIDGLLALLGEERIEREDEGVEVLDFSDVEIEEMNDER